MVNYKIPRSFAFPGYSPYSYGYNNPIMFGDPSGLAPEKHKQGNGDVLLGDIYMWKNMAAVAEYYGAKTNISKDGLEPLESYPVKVSTHAFMLSWMSAAHELGHIFDALRLGHDPFFDIPAGVREWWAIDSENMMRVKMGFGNVLKSKSDLFGVPKYLWDVFKVGFIIEVLIMRTISYIVILVNIILISGCSSAQYYEEKDFEPKNIEFIESVLFNSKSIDSAFDDFNSTIDYNDINRDAKLDHTHKIFFESLLADLKDKKHFRESVHINEVKKALWRDFAGYGMYSLSGIKYIGSFNVETSNNCISFIFLKKSDKWYFEGISRCSDLDEHIERYLARSDFLKELIDCISLHQLFNSFEIDEEDSCKSFETSHYKITFCIDEFKRFYKDYLDLVFSDRDYIISTWAKKDWYIKITANKYSDTTNIQRGQEIDFDQFRSLSELVSFEDSLKIKDYNGFQYGHLGIEKRLGEDDQIASAILYLSDADLDLKIHILKYHYKPEDREELDNIIESFKIERKK